MATATAVETEVVYEDGNLTPPQAQDDPALRGAVLCTFGGCSELAVTSMLLGGTIKELCARCRTTCEALFDVGQQVQTQSGSAPQSQPQLNAFVAERIVRGDPDVQEFAHMMQAPLRQPVASQEQITFQ